MEADPANAPSRSDIRRRMALLAGIVLVADQITKQVILDWIFFPPMRVSVLPFLDFVPVWNPGISFGMLACPFHERPFTFSLAASDKMPKRQAV